MSTLEKVLDEDPSDEISEADLLGDNVPSRCVVRIRTSAFKTARGLATRTDIEILRRLSSGYICLEEDADNVGAEKVLGNIIDLHKAGDGIYEVVMCNYTHDWETGYVEDWDYMLVPIVFHGPPLWMFLRSQRR